MLIIGIASSAILLALPGPQDDVRASATRVAARAVAARDLAIVSGRPVRLRPRQQGADVGALAAEIAGPAGWQPVPELQPLTLAARQQIEAPAAIAFDAAGLASPARLIIRQGDAVASVTIDAAGGVHAGPT